MSEHCSRSCSELVHNKLASATVTAFQSSDYSSRVHKRTHATTRKKHIVPVSQPKFVVYDLNKSIHLMHSQRMFRKMERDQGPTTDEGRNLLTIMSLDKEDCSHFESPCVRVRTFFGFFMVIASESLGELAERARKAAGNANFRKGTMCFEHTLTYLMKLINL